jgi:glycosyltransferase involved in cell wall biosynthesis
VGGIPEIITDGVNGSLVVAGDARALARASIDLIQNPQKREGFASRLHERATTDFSIERMLDATFLLYR